MRQLLITVICTAVLAGPAVAKDMKSCSADWKTAKAGGSPLSHKDFMASCLKGGTSVSQTVTTKPAGGQAMTTTTAAPTTTPPAGAPAGATAKCKDGSFSKSAHHSGACSHHDGVAQFLN